MSETTLTIKKFTSLSKRRDIKAPTWFAMPNNILLHPDFLNITGDEVKVFLWILGTASQLNEETIRVYPELCARQINVTTRVVASTIEKLNGKRWDVTSALRKRDTNVQNPYATEHYTTLQNTTEHKYSSQKPGELVSGNEQFPALDFFHKIKPISEALISSWIEAYGEGWVRDEILAAKQWCLANALKTPKSEAGRFLNGWLKRGWERHRKNIASTKVSRIDYDALK